MPDLICTLLQSSLVWEDKKANLSAFEEKIKSLQGKTQVVILPEMFSTGFSMHPDKFAEPMDGPTVNWLRDVSAKNRLIVTGSLIIQENGHYYNRLVWMQPNGQYAFYDKRHLFGYAGEDRHYSAGNRRVIVSVNGWRLLLQVCYDLRFPVWARQQPTSAHPYEYDAIIYVANWPQRRSLAWKTLLQARAIENMAYVIGLNRVGNDGNNIYHSGDSRVIDALGNVLYEKEDAEDSFTFTLEKEKLEAIRQHFPFSRDADMFSIRV